MIQDVVTQPTAEAKIVIDAPKTGAVGELIRLDVTGSTAESFKWLLVPQSVDFEFYDGGKKAVFSARTPGSYMFIIACASGGTVDVVTHVVAIGDGGVSPPTPPTPPTPPNPDDPIIPVPLSDLQSRIIKWCTDSKLPKLEASKLAASFSSVASTIAAGVNTTPEQIVAATGEANRAALGTSIEAWIPVLKNIQGDLKKESEAGNLQTAQQHQDMWTAIAKALETYATLK